MRKNIVFMVLSFLIVVTAYFADEFPLVKRWDEAVAVNGKLLCKYVDVRGYKRVSTYHTAEIETENYGIVHDPYLTPYEYQELKIGESYTFYVFRRNLIEPPAMYDFLQVFHIVGLILGIAAFLTSLVFFYIEF